MRSTRILMADVYGIPRTADVVIVGGGIIGVSIAVHLAERGMTDVVILEREAVAAGATSQATGGIRQQFTTESQIRLSVESVRFYERFAERVGQPLAFRQVGYLFLLSTPGQNDAFRQAVALQNSLGVPSELLAAETIARQHPMIDTTGIVGGSFCPTDGVAAPADAAYGLAARARELGVRICEGVEVTAIEQSAGRVTGVQTTAGAIACGDLVNAAGPWAAGVAAMAGLEVPVTAHPRQVFTLQRLPELPSDFPFTIDLKSGTYVHQEQSATLLGGGDRDAPSGGEPVVNWERFEATAVAASRWLPAVAEAEVRSGWCGLREMTPDDHPILGPVPGLAGLWLAVGFSGHGFMHAPAAGRILAEWMTTGGAAGFDPDPFALDRFQQRRLAHDAAVF
jgi:sarcosine oxidase subunit beta